jgi:hypothetical protein
VLFSEFVWRKGTYQFSFSNDIGDYRKNKRFINHQYNWVNKL